jgi:pimeloyl-ACP methyl ester carboxylesterase
VSGSAQAAPETVRIASEGETLLGDLYGDLPSRRAAILVHGQQWDASGWRDVAQRFVARGVPALAFNLRGYDGSTGKTNDFAPPVPWSPIADLRAAKALLRERGVREIALVGASMGGHAILASSFEADVECIVSVSAPVTAVPDELSRKITGRKLFVCADGDRAAPHVLHTFDVVARPKTLLMFGGSEHSRAMFAAPYGAEAIEAIIDFVARVTEPTVRGA